MIPINSRQIRIRTITQYLNEGLTYGDDVVFQGKASVVQIIGSNNQDGTQGIIYIAKPELVDIKKSNVNISVPKLITNDSQIKEKSRSQYLRQKAYRVAQEIGGDAESLYNDAISAGVEFLDQLEESYKGVK